MRNIFISSRFACGQNQHLSKKKKKRIPNFVRNQILEIYAVIHKRGWLEDVKGSKENLMSTIQHMIDHNLVFPPLRPLSPPPPSTHSSKIKSKQSLAGHILDVVVHEFGDSGSNIEMSWEFHENARQSFQDELLLQIFTLTLQSLQKFSSDLMTSNSQAVSKQAFESIQPFLSLLQNTLVWDFSKFNFAKTFAERFKRKYKVPTKVMPPDTPEWKQVITNPAILDILISVRSHSPPSYNPASHTEIYIYIFIFPFIMNTATFLHERKYNVQSPNSTIHCSALFYFSKIVCKRSIPHPIHFKDVGRTISHHRVCLHLPSFLPSFPSSFLLVLLLRTRKKTAS